MTEVNVGDRVKLQSNSKGTVRFIGETKASKGILYGIELDNPEGKFDGRIGNIRHFSCKENHGVFVRFSQLSKLVEAVETYHLNEELLSSVTVLEDKAPSAESNKKLPKSNLPVFNVLNPQRIKDRQIVGPSCSQSKGNCHRVMFPDIPLVDKENYVDSETEKSSIIGSTNDLFLSTAKLKDTSTSGDKRKSKSAERLPNFTQGNSQNKPTLHENQDNMDSCQRCAVIIEDYKEKLCTLKELKKRDREKIILFQISNKDLLLQLEKMSEKNEKCLKEKDDISLKFSDYEQSMHDILENVESITIDKEVAEEEVERQKDIITDLKQEIEKLTNENKKFTLIIEGQYETRLDCPIIKKYLCTITELSNSINNLKSKDEDKDKEMDDLLEKQINLEIEIDRILRENLTFKEDIKDMKDQIDNTLCAVEIVDNLTHENLRIENILEVLNTRVLELDETNDKISHELEDKISEIRQLRRKNATLDHQIQTMAADANSTTRREEQFAVLTDQFRIKIRDLETENSVLKLRVELKTRTDKGSLTTSEGQKHSIYSDESKLIDGKLKELALAQNVQLVSILLKFLDNSFNKSDGYIDIVNTMLLVDRYLEKIGIILAYMNKRKGVRPVVLSFRLHLEFLLLNLQEILDQLKRNLSRCDLTRVNIFINNYIAMQSHEEAIDVILGWIQKDCFEDSRNLNSLTNTIEYFRGLFVTNFQSTTDCDQKINHFVKIINVGSQCLYNYMEMLSLLELKVSVNHQLKDWIDCVKNFTVQAQCKVKSLFKHLSYLSKIQFPFEFIETIDKGVLLITCVVQSASQFVVDISTDKISLRDLKSQLSNILSVTFKCPISESDKHVVQAMTCITETVDKVAQFLDDYNLDMNRDSTNKNFESIVDKIVKRHMECMTHLNGLTVDITQKKKKIKELTVESGVQSQLLTEAMLGIEHVKYKMTKRLQEKEAELKSLKEKFQDGLEDKKSSNTVIYHLNCRVSSLLQHINSLENAQNDIMNAELSDINNKDGYITQIRVLKACIHSLTSRLHCVESRNVKAKMRDLRPLGIVSSAALIDIDGYIRKSETITRDIYERLSCIEIPTLSKPRMKTSREAYVALAGIKSQINQLKNAGSVRQILM